MDSEKDDMVAITLGTDDTSDKVCCSALNTFAGVMTMEPVGACVALSIGDPTSGLLEKMKGST